MDNDQLLVELEAALKDAKIDATHQAAIWIGTGLNIAASIVEHRRIELLCAGILNDVGEDQSRIQETF